MTTFADLFITLQALFVRYQVALQWVAIALLLTLTVVLAGAANDIVFASGTASGPLLAPPNCTGC